ncbi:hypothetical protein NLU13_1803 [Sarocladium strictum]|uniref:Aspartate aminotransferase n=1 Tax=Sarocladium strictum TaxID=5046 RepID=A0AA39GUF7_SARSR|nr:hypothetical protein NLU13_1803 [Sarocladium strictum]
MATNSLFNELSVPEAPPDSHYGLRAEFQADRHPDKVNLVIGAYKDDQGRPWILPVVRKICSVQTISGTGAVHLGAVFLSKFLSEPKPTVYLSGPTWDNHVPVFAHAGLPIKHYPYFSEEYKSIDFAGMIEALAAAPRGSVVVLQACAHNPTGVDPSPKQWQEVANVVRRSGLFPFFDCAYQGFATGDLANDSYPIRYFASLGIEMFIAQSFSKNLGLYGQRAGCLHFLAQSTSDAASATRRVSSQLTKLQRCEISTPAAYGARIASIVLNDDQLSREWMCDLATMSQRIAKMRAELRCQLEKLGTPGTFKHITAQIGMFAYTGLTEEQVGLLKSKWHIYMLASGRMSVSGLNTGNVQYVAKAIDDVVRSTR